MDRHRSGPGVSLLIALTGIESSSGAEVARVQANADGEYAVALPAGSDHVVPLSPPNSPLPYAGPSDITVQTGA
ncbi:MAG: hypothetical protein O3B31_11660 [Chloroflexi bacterium]|nr:hypothetical protein [Chloroflexota bacterium]